MGGDYISMQCRKILQDIHLSPAYMIGSKELLKDYEKPRWIKKKSIPQESKWWHNYMIKKLAQDFQITTLQIFETPYDENIV